MATDIRTSTMTLKEWAVTIKALDAGQQILLLRKGGISEPAGEFRVEHDEFFFYPSYEHQKPHLIKAAFQDDLAAVLQGWAPGSSRLPITHWARVTEVLRVTTEEEVAALSLHYIWTEDYARERLHWNPGKPLNVLLVRVYRLPRPHVIEVRPEYSGCTSWIPVGEAISRAGAEPVLAEEAYAARVQAVRASLAG